MRQAEEIEALAARCAALETVWRSVGRTPGGSTESVRRIARSMVPALEIYGPPALVEQARKVVDGADEGELTELVPELIEGLRRALGDLPRETSRVLVVEDDPVEADRLGVVLGGAHRQIRTAFTLDEARAVLASDPVDLVVVSLELDGSDGRDLLVDLQSRSATAAVPTVVLTTSQDAVTRAECFALGADELLESPVEPHILSAAVSSLLRRRAALTRMAQEDHLTGLPNRAAFASVFAHLQALAERNQEPLALVLLDVDFLKEVNDREGHHAGDLLLRELAHGVEATLRDSDVLARWGGDEFAVLLPRTGTAGAREALEKARQAFRNVSVGGDDAFAALGMPSFSAGVTRVRFREPVEEAVARADRLLYRAKARGRDAVVGDDQEVADREEAGSGPDVLLVEDEDAVADVFRRFLERAGFGVRRVARGEAALKEVSFQVPDLVVLDILLPGKDGFEVLRELRSDVRSQDVPVLILTALGSEELVVRGFSLGADEYLVKPVTRERFVTRVRQLVRTRAGR